jgi:hypothetical protein
MLTCLAVGKDSFQCGSWEFRFIIGDSQLPNGNLLRRGFRSAFLVGKASYCLLEGD